MTTTDKEKKLKDLKDQKAKIVSLKEKIVMLKVKMQEAKSKYDDKLPDLDKI